MENGLNNDTIITIRVTKLESRPTLNIF